MVSIITPSLSVEKAAGPHTHSNPGPDPDVPTGSTASNGSERPAATWYSRITGDFLRADRNPMSPAARCLMLVLDDEARGKPFVTCSNEDMGRWLKLGPRQAGNHLAALIELGWVAGVYSPGPKPDSTPIRHGIILRRRAALGMPCADNPERMAIVETAVRSKWRSAPGENDLTYWSRILGTEQKGGSQSVTKGVGKKLLGGVGKKLPHPKEACRTSSKKTPKQTAGEVSQGGERNDGEANPAEVRAIRLRLAGGLLANREASETVIPAVNSAPTDDPWMIEFRRVRAESRRNQTPPAPSLEPEEGIQPIGSENLGMGNGVAIEGGRPGASTPLSWRDDPREPLGDPRESGQAPQPLTPESATVLPAGPEPTDLVPGPELSPPPALVALDPAPLAMVPDTVPVVVEPIPVATSTAATARPASTPEWGRSTPEQFRRYSTLTASEQAEVAAIRGSTTPTPAQLDRLQALLGGTVVGPVSTSSAPVVTRGGSPGPDAAIVSEFENLAHRLAKSRDRTSAPLFGRALGLVLGGAEDLGFADAYARVGETIAAGRLDPGWFCWLVNVSIRKRCPGAYLWATIQKRREGRAACAAVDGLLHPRRGSAHPARSLV